MRVLRVIGTRWPVRDGSAGLGQNGPGSVARHMVSTDGVQQQGGRQQFHGTHDKHSVRFDLPYWIKRRCSHHRIITACRLVGRSNIERPINKK